LLLSDTVAVVAQKHISTRREVARSRPSARPSAPAAIRGNARQMQAALATDVARDEWEEF
jgi:hypothetical protein